MIIIEAILAIFIVLNVEMLFLQVLLYYIDVAYRCTQTILIYKLFMY